MHWFSLPTSGKLYYILYTCAGSCTRDQMFTGIVIYCDTRITDFQHASYSGSQLLIKYQPSWVSILRNNWVDKDKCPAPVHCSHTYWPWIRNLVMQSNLNPGCALIYTLLNQVRVRELFKENVNEAFSIFIIVYKIQYRFS